MEVGRLMSLLELTQSFLRLVSSNPMESGNLTSSLKFAFSSSSDLERIQRNQSYTQRLEFDDVNLLRGVPAILNSFGEVNEKVARDIKDLELRETANGVWKSFDLV